MAEMMKRLIQRAIVALLLSLMPAIGLSSETQFSMSTTSSSINPSPHPHIVRICCYAGWAGMEPSRGSYQFTSKVHPWKTQAQSLGADFLMTFLEVPTWANGTGSGGNTYTPPVDLTTVATCQNVLAGVHTTNCQWKEMVTAYFQDDCGVTSQPLTPLTGGACKTKYVEAWNEINVCRYACNFTPGQLAILANDMTKIARLYSGDVQIGVGSVSAGGDGSNNVGMSPVYYTAELQFLQAWGAIPGFSKPDFSTIHIYCCRTNVSPLPFPETIVSTSSLCSSGTPNSSCRIAVIDEVDYFRIHVLQDPSISSWAASLRVACTECGWGEIKSICDGASSASTCNITDPTHGANVTLLRRAYTARLLEAAWSQRTMFFLQYEYGGDACWMPMVGPGDTSGCPYNSPVGSNLSNPPLPSGNLPWLQAYTQMVSWLDSATYVAPESGTAACSGKIWTMPVKISGVSAMLAFYDGHLGSCSYSTTFTSAQKLDGTTISVSSTATLTNEPMFLTTPSTPPLPPPPPSPPGLLLGVAGGR